MLSGWHWSSSVGMGAGTELLLWVHHHQRRSIPRALSGDPGAAGSPGAPQAGQLIPGLLGRRASDAAERAKLRLRA